MAKSRWTNKEEKFLRENWETTSGTKIAKKLKKSPSCVWNKAMQIGLRRKELRKTEVETAAYADEKMKQLEKNLNFKIGKKVQIQDFYGKYENSKVKIIKGIIIFQNNFFVTVKTKKYPESFKKVDFLTGKTKLI